MLSNIHGSKIEGALPQCPNSTKERIEKYIEECGEIEEEFEKSLKFIPSKVPVPPKWDPNSEETPELFQLENKTNFKRDLLDNLNTHPHPFLSIIEIHPQFVQWGERGNWIDINIRSGAYLRCVAGEIMSPGKFYLNLVEHWEDLEAFMRYLQKEIESDGENFDTHFLPIPTIPLLFPGLFVLGYYENEWHRALVLQNPIYNDTFRGDPGDPKNIIIKLHLVDYGTDFSVTIDKIRFMRRDYMESFPFQGIECRLLFNKSHEKKVRSNGYIWRQGATKTLINYVKGKKLGVNFMEREQLPTQIDGMTRGRWSVVINVLVGDADCGLKEGEKHTTNVNLNNRENYDATRQTREVDESLATHPNGKFATCFTEENCDISKHIPL